ncbi:MAG: hypothetical protein M1416_02985 [Candidatus Pacearchaeota archaeon]|nr:hypothetical protein [Candidatus Pacearchaeota archaeon]
MDDKKSLEKRLAFQKRILRGIQEIERGLYNNIYEEYSSAKESRENKLEEFKEVVEYEKNFSQIGNYLIKAENKCKKEISKIEKEIDKKYTNISLTKSN